MSSGIQGEKERLYNLGLELENAVSLIESGFATLQNMSTHRNREFIALLLLTNGFERLMKVVLVLQTLAFDNRFLNMKELKDLGHELGDLCEKVLQQCFIQTYLRLPAAVADRQFMEHDSRFRRVLQIMTEFAKGGRYNNLDGTVEPGRMEAGQDRQWSVLELQQLAATELKHLLRSNQGDEANRRSVHSISACLETFVRALARLFTLAELGPRARQLSPYLRDYYGLSNQDLGLRQYQL